MLPSLEQGPLPDLRLIQTVSHHIRGECNIKQEITSEQNPRFVLHDSMGFEPGQTQTYDNAKAFLESRGEGAALKDRVHAIWWSYVIGQRSFSTHGW